MSRVRFYHGAKRVLDLVFAATGLVLLSPVFVIIGFLIKKDDGGPLFFMQERIGRFGARFRIIKFRTMVIDAEAKGLRITTSTDPRVTRIGRRLRSTKLDELPQLLNVLRGEMSFVGPRPEVPKYVAYYTPEQRQVLSLVPGLTDLASLEYIDEESLLAKVERPEEVYISECLPRKIELNLAYARRAGLAADVGIILRTIGKLFFRRGAPTDATR